MDVNQTLGIFFMSLFVVQIDCRICLYVGNRDIKYSGCCILHQAKNEGGEVVRCVPEPFCLYVYHEMLRNL